MLGCQAFEQEWGEGWPCYDTNLAAFQMKITFLSCLLDTGLYHNKVTFSLTPIKGLATKYKTVKWPIAWARRARAIHSLLKICKCLLHQIVRKIIYYFIIYYLYIVFRIWDDTVYDTVASDGWLIDPKWCILLSCFWIRRISCISSMYIEIITDASEVTIWLGPLANTTYALIGQEWDALQNLWNCHFRSLCFHAV